MLASMYRPENRRSTRYTTMPFKSPGVLRDDTAEIVSGHYEASFEAASFLTHTFDFGSIRRCSTFLVWDHMSITYFKFHGSTAHGLLSAYVISMFLELIVFQDGGRWVIESVKGPSVLGIADEPRYGVKSIMKHSQRSGRPVLRKMVPRPRVSVFRSGLLGLTPRFPLGYQSRTAMT